MLEWKDDHNTVLCFVKVQEGLVVQPVAGGVSRYFCLAMGRNLHAPCLFK